jgi:hypothetical protein
MKAKFDYEDISSYDYQSTRLALSKISLFFAYVQMIAILTDLQSDLIDKLITINLK